MTGMVSSGLAARGILLRGGPDGALDIVGRPAAMTHGFLTTASKGLTLWDLFLYGLIVIRASAAVLFGVLLWKDGGGGGSGGDGAS
jgi:hypothetical protein